MDGLEKLILLALVVLLAEVDEEDDGLRRQQLFAYGVSAVGVSLRSGMQSFVFATRFVHVFSARVSSMCFQLVFRACVFGLGLRLNMCFWVAIAAQG